MKTKTLGEILRSEREFHRLTLAELAKRTRIRRHYLEALENNQYDALPAAIFVRGYVKTYGQVFGFDYQPLIAMLRRDFKESSRGKLIPLEFIKPKLKNRRLWAPLTMVMMMLAGLFVSLGGYVGYQWFQLQQPPSLEISAPITNQLVGPQVVVTGKTNPDALVTVNSQPVSLQLDGSFQTPVFLPRDGLNTISVEATDRRGKTNLQQRTVRVEF